ncbi:hypothetical protein RSAG8_07363, partial [Rhizoctonia solani AG-8 WAC10335]
MYERVRHKLNNKDSATKATRPKGAQIELQDSMDTIHARHEQQGFMDLDPVSPYRLDLQAHELKEIASARMFLYERGGYGCISNMQRERNRLDIPRDIDDFAELLNLNSGAELYIVAAWPTGNGQIEYYEMATINSDMVLEDRQSSPYSLERGRERFLRLQSDRNAMLSSTHVRNAPPAVYATFDGSDRPMLPLMNLPFQWKAPIIIGYLTALWLWQGAVLPIPWETEETLLNSTDRIVQPRRDYDLSKSHVSRLVKEYVLFEQSQPLHASRARWQMYGGDCSQMKVACPVSSFFIEVLGGWWLPPSFFLRARTRETIGNQMDFLMRDDWYDLLTGTLYGGPYGIRWMVLLLIRSFWTLSMVDNAEAPDKPSYVRSDAFTPHDLEHVLLDIDYLTEEMQLGIKRIHNIRDLHESHEHQQIGLIDMEFFRVGWAPDPPVVEPEEEPLPYSPGRLQSILKDKPKGKAKKGKRKVVILLPAPKVPIHREKPGLVLAGRLLVDEEFVLKPHMFCVRLSATAPDHAEIEQICQELLAISRRIELDRAPSPEQVRERLAYLLDPVIDLLAAGSSTEIAAITLGERADQGIFHMYVARQK